MKYVAKTITSDKGNESTIDHGAAKKDDASEVQVMVQNNFSVLNTVEEGEIPSTSTSKDEGETSNVNGHKDDQSHQVETRLNNADIIQPDVQEGMPGTFQEKETHSSLADEVEERQYDDGIQSNAVGDSSKSDSVEESINGGINEVEKELNTGENQQEDGEHGKTDGQTGTNTAEQGTIDNPNKEEVLDVVKEISEGSPSVITHNPEQREEKVQEYVQSIEATILAQEQVYVEQDADPPDHSSLEKAMVISQTDHQVTFYGWEGEEDVRDLHREDKEENIKKIKENILKQADISPNSMSNNKGQKKVKKNAIDKQIPLRVRTINQYRRRLGMCLANGNCNGKIWYFVAGNIYVEVLMDSPQQITLKLFLQDLNQYLITTLVYAKCSASERIELWEDIYHLSNTLSCSWLVGGDFNVVLNDEEKIGGNPGSPFTWWNGRADAACIFERLDRMLVNSLLLDNFGHIEVEHLARTGSDHAPLMCTYGDKHQKLVKPFKFLSFWIEHASFLDTVRQNWSIWEHDDPFINFKSKMKKLKGGLSKWSREVFGDIFKQLIIREEIVTLKEKLFEQNPSQVNRLVLHKALAETKRYLHYEKEYWRQKSGMDWFVDGDKNTRFFHNLVKGRRKKLQIKRIQNSDGSWIEDEDQMADEAVHFYSQQFSQEELIGDENLLSLIPVLIDQNRNDLLCQMPSVDEVKNVVFNLSGASDSGPDGFPGVFYQTCWDIIGFDVYKMVVDFFQGHTLPKSVTHTNLVLLPKKELIQSYLDLRPISLSNFINKVMSRVVHDRLESVLPQLISINQASFVQGRSIIENVLLAQEIAKGFFHSTRGVKQGDPLSPSLFILSTEVLSRALKAEFDDAEYVGYEGESLKRIMKILQEYEAISGQLINKGKSAFYMHDKIAGALSQQVEQITGFKTDQFPLTYLGCPIFH
ncbi:uncharacterized protein LOC132637628 [Lycium barbarum]|uniref:uncharacterized protein LOC132637628 n=1 Tax=Lycium barbarum TaxID=112863 RepID=UPI00293EC0DE|nr:uncharacterized protein LOC132637628 [Lycium barbarum]